MRTLQLKINDKVYDKFLWLLSKFNKEEIEIISDDAVFLETKEYLQSELNEIQEGQPKFISQSEFENRIDRII